MKVNSKYLVITSDYVLPGLIIIAVFALIWLCFYSNFFKIARIECQIDYLPCENTSLETEIAKVEGVNIFRLDEKALKTKILSGEYTIRAVELKKFLPNRLLVSMQSVYPSLAVMQLGDNRYVTLDDKYRIISIREQNPNIATVVVPSLPVLQVGQILSSELNPVFKLTQRVTEQIPGVVSLTLRSDRAVVVTIDKNMQIVMSTQIDLDSQIRLLQAVLRDSTITKGKSEVDVRFAQPILK